MAVEKVIKKKRGVESLNAHLALVMKSGKAFLGYRACLRAIRANKAMDYFATDLGFAYQEGDKIYEDAKIVVGGKNCT